VEVTVQKLLHSSSRIPPLVIVASSCGRKDRNNFHFLSIVNFGLNLIRFFGMLVASVAKVSFKNVQVLILQLYTYKNDT